MLHVLRTGKRLVMTMSAMMTVTMPAVVSAAAVMTVTAIVRAMSAVVAMTTDSDIQTHTVISWLSVCGPVNGRVGIRWRCVSISCGC